MDPIIDFEVKKEQATIYGDEWTVDPDVAKKVRWAGIKLGMSGTVGSPAQGMRLAWTEFWEKWRAARD